MKRPSIAWVSGVYVNKAKACQYFLAPRYIPLAERRKRNTIAHGWCSTKRGRISLDEDAVDWNKGIITESCMSRERAIEERLRLQTHTKQQFALKNVDCKTFADIITVFTDIRKQAMPIRHIQKSGSSLAEEFHTNMFWRTIWLRNLSTISLMIGVIRSSFYDYASAR